QGSTSVRVIVPSISKQNAVLSFTGLRPLVQAVPSLASVASIVEVAIGKDVPTGGEYKASGPQRLRKDLLEFGLGAIDRVVDLVEDLGQVLFYRQPIDSSGWLPHENPSAGICYRCNVL